MAREKKGIYRNGTNLRVFRIKKYHIFMVMNVIIRHEKI